MDRHRIILDCDPGVDDAIAILLAIASPAEIEIAAITSVAGNVPLVQTTRNARRVCALAGRSDIPIYAGCDRPILPADRHPSGVHGSDGLGDIGLPDASALQAKHAVDVIIDLVRASPGAVTLCPVGPLTNIALALLKAPDIARLVSRIILMGGAAFSPGNSTPEAEFNVWFDPHAAEVVFSADIPIVMFGLDATRQARMSRDSLASLAMDGGPVTSAAVAMMTSYGRSDPCLHDPCVIAYLLEPSLFDGVDASISVDCISAIGLGRTVAAVSERHRQGRRANCNIITHVQAERLFALLQDRLKRLDDSAAH